MKMKRRVLRSLILSFVMVMPFAFTSLAILVSSIGVAQAQTSSARTNPSNRSGLPNAEFQISNLLAQVRPSKRAGFALIPVTGNVRNSGSVFSITPMGESNPQIVKSLNGLMGDLTLLAGPNIAITPGANTLTIGATGLLSFITHNTTLSGNGTPASPLGIANVGVGTTQLADLAVTALKLNTPTAPTAGQVLSFNGGSMIWQTPASSITSVAHDGTLTGDGTDGSALGLAIPLALESSGFTPVLRVVNSQAGVGLSAEGGPVPSFGSGTAGAGVVGRGGDGSGGASHGGAGVTARGGNGVFGAGPNPASFGEPGLGLEARGGDANGENRAGGTGAVITGGRNTTNIGVGGTGAVITGGNASDAGAGGHAVFAVGGDASYPTDPVGHFNHAGNGITAVAGQALNGASRGLAADFTGDVEVSGDLNVSGTKNFKIDHPLDPENKYLFHAAIESSEVLNIYSGNVTTDASGNASVTLPDWFESINNDLRYQLTVIGTFAQAIVGEKVKNNRLIIKTNAPNVEVSWQVTGVRSDAAMLKHPFKVEQDKPERERGHYLSPEAYDQSEERGIDWARNPELMKQMKQRRESAKQKRAQQ